MGHTATGNQSLELLQVPAIVNNRVPIRENSPQRAVLIRAEQHILILVHTTHTVTQGHNDDLGIFLIAGELDFLVLLQLGIHIPIDQRLRRVQPIGQLQQGVMRRPENTTVDADDDFTVHGADNDIGQLVRNVLTFGHFSIQLGQSFIERHRPIVQPVAGNLGESTGPVTHHKILMDNVTGSRLTLENFTHLYTPEKRKIKPYRPIVARNLWKSSPKTEHIRGDGK